MPELFSGENREKKVLIVSHSIALKCLICESMKPGKIFADGVVGDRYWDNTEIKPLFIDMNDKHFYSIWNFNNWNHWAYELPI